MATDVQLLRRGHHPAMSPDDRARLDALLAEQAAGRAEVLRALAASAEYEAAERALDAANAAYRAARADLPAHHPWLQPLRFARAEARQRLEHEYNAVLASLNDRKGL